MACANTIDYQASSSVIGEGLLIFQSIHIERPFDFGEDSSIRRANLPNYLQSISVHFAAPIQSMTIIKIRGGKVYQRLGRTLLGAQKQSTTPLHTHCLFLFGKRSLAIRQATSQNIASYYGSAKTRGVRRPCWSVGAQLIDA